MSGLDLTGKSWNKFGKSWNKFGLFGLWAIEDT
jgi:hypothetical protein